MVNLFLRRAARSARKQKTVQMESYQDDSVAKFIGLDVLVPQEEDNGLIDTYTVNYDVLTSVPTYIYVVT